MNKHLLTITLLVFILLTLSACGEKKSEQPQVPTSTKITETTKSPTVPTATQLPPTSTPTPTPEVRNGAWVDTLFFTVQEDADTAIAQLESKDIDIYAHNISDPELYQKVKNSDELSAAESFGSYTELTFNPVGPEYGEGELNPFSNPKIREAVNWIIDRDYVVKEIYGGLAIPKFLPINSVFPDYARYIDTAHALEAKYAYNMDKAKEVITAEMAGMGAEIVDGKWTYNGSPVTIKFIIRPEDERKEIGDYVANQFEAVGFTVDRMYKNRTEAADLWIKTNPAEGQWTVYTGGWSTASVDRDQGSNFIFYYSPLSPYGDLPLWQAYNPDPEFEEVSLKLQKKELATLEERDELFRKAMELALKDSAHVWITDLITFSPYRSDVTITADLAGGIASSQVYPYTVRRVDQIGGQIKIAQPTLFMAPWNPLGGSNWIYDTMPQWATGEFATIADPTTGLHWPNRIEKAELVVKKGLPVTKTLDWIDLKFEDEIIVPDDAWVDWDAENQKFITAGEKFTETITANTKSVVYYPKDMFETVTWHDGSPLSPGDFVLGMIMSFDRGKEVSAIYDETIAPDLESFLSHFKGVRIVSTDPLIIETYDDQYALDAENSISTWWPYYNYGQAPWHTLAVGYKAEANKELAFSPDKADALEVEWMDYISGPSIEALKKYLDEATTDGFIPYEATMSKYVTADEATSRYKNLSKFYRQYHHFWVGTGPFILKTVNPVEGFIELERNKSYPDSTNKWEQFSPP